jgi:hypothetical protein
MDVVEPFRIQERPDSQRDRHVVPEGAQARNFHGQPGSQHALELVCRKEEGAFSVAAPASAVLCAPDTAATTAIAAHGLLLSHDRVHFVE